MATYPRLQATLIAAVQAFLCQCVSGLAVQALLLRSISGDAVFTFYLSALDGVVKQRQSN
jgi:hypothetical protein